MKLDFFKYQGAGNDFIIIDNRQNNVELTDKQIQFLCDRRFGIGADGLMYLNNRLAYDFSMVYFNADGSESTMCGNGGRCIVQFAKDLKIINNHTRFYAIDGEHSASIKKDNYVSLGMVDVNEMRKDNNGTILNTGSPHLVISVKNLDSIDVKQMGSRLRNMSQYGVKGINVNFIEVKNGLYYIRTYERGVEDETLACGTGVTAAAIMSTNDQIGKFEMVWHALGGELKVEFEKKSPHTATNVILSGPAYKVFEGTINL